MINKKLHFIGAGGAGCSAAFAIAKNLGYGVSGCDREKDSPYLDKKLRSLVFLGHSKDHLNDVDTLIYSPAVTAFDEENEEIDSAKKKGIEVLGWDEFVAKKLAKNKFVIAVAGTHGKGTVTAMLGVILEKSGLDPTCLVGARVSDWDANFRVGKSKYLLVEADEYSEKLLKFSPNLAAITNIEFDHPEYFKDFNQMLETFKKFVSGLKKNSILVVGPGVALNNPNGETIQVSKPSDLNLKMIGEFNRINAAIATALAERLNIDEGVISKALENFKGVARRFEFKGEQKGVLIFDDYAHHPTAVSKTLKAARERFPDKKIWLVFQPHLFTRTKVLFDDFVAAFENIEADEVILVGIFAAREKDTGQLDSGDIAHAVKNRKIKYIPDFREAATHIANKISVGSVVVSMGAGDIYEFSPLLLEKLEGKG
jgi:UDP-N-acetylmuramate--alanine ligase